MSTRLKLFLMMVLEIAIWGAWLPVVYGYLNGIGFTPLQISVVLSAFPVGAILAMFFSTQYADRHFSAEKFLAFSHLIGGAAMLGLAYTRDFYTFAALMYVHCLLYVPTISITNSIAFTHMKNPDEEFGPIRLGGTIGWILVQWPFVFLLVDWTKVKEKNAAGFVEWLGYALGTSLTGDEFLVGVTWAFKVSAFISFALAIFSLTLPPTPPKKGEALAWLEAFKLLKLPFIAVLWVVTFIDAAVHQSFFLWTGDFLKYVGVSGNWVQPVMSIGQIAEILTMLVLGITLKKLGWKATMLVGILGHVLRFAVFAYLPQHMWLIIAVNVVHGICYAFFFATVYIFVDAYFPKDARSSAQGLFNVMVLGAGPLVANFVCPWIIGSMYTLKAAVVVDGKTVEPAVVDYHGLFLVPCAAALAAVVILALFFHPPKNKEVAEHAV